MATKPIKKLVQIKDQSFSEVVREEGATNATVNLSLKPKSLPKENVEVDLAGKKSKPKVFFKFFQKIGWLIPLIIFLIIIVALLYSSNNSWKAVFTDDGRVYFGKFISIPFKDSIKLKSAFFASSAEGEDLRIISKAKESYGPSGTMHIMKNHILYWETLNDTSSIVKLLNVEEKK